MSIITELSTEQFKEIVAKSKCYADICRNLGLRREGGFYRTIQRRIKREKIGIEHFLPLSVLLSNKLNFNWISKEEFISKLENRHPFCEDTIKKKIKEFDLIPYLCSECSLKDNWNGKSLTLQLDHKDGNHKNNLLSNFRWLCPNCHSQTETFCGRHKKIKLKLKSKRGENLKQFWYNRPTKRPKKEELEPLLGIISFRAIGKKYGVSDNAVKKWCKFYGLPFRKKDMVGDSGVEPLNEVCKTSSFPLA